MDDFTTIMNSNFRNRFAENNNKETKVNRWLEKNDWEKVSEEDRQRDDV